MSDTTPATPSESVPSENPLLARLSDTAETVEEQADVPTYPRYYWTILTLLALTYITLGGLVFYFVPSLQIGSRPLYPGVLILLGGVLHFIAGLKIVPENQIYLIIVLGTITKQVTSALVCVPPGLFWFVPYPTETKDMEIPADPQHIWRGTDPPPEAHMRNPIRITFRGERGSSDPLEQRVTEEVVPIIRLRIDNAANFRVRIGTLEEAKRQLEDVTVSVLAEVLPYLTLDEAIKNIAPISALLQKRLRDSTRGWGAFVVMARVKQFPFTKSFNKAIQQIAESVAQKQTTINNAEAAERDLTLRGQGKANAVLSDLNARTTGLTQMAQQMGVGPETVLGSMTARSIAEGPNNLIIAGTDGFAGLMGVVAAGAEALKKNSSPATSTTSPANGDTPTEDPV